MLGSAQAHHVWIEQPEAGQKSKNATLFFGEFGDNLREVSPGRLDGFVKPVALKISSKGAESLDIQKTPGGFVMGAHASRGDSIVAEDPAYPISERKEGEATVRVLYHPAARLVTAFARQEPQLTLDLVPTGSSGKDGKDGVEFQVFYKGQPLPNAKVEAITAAGWSQQHRANEQGKLTVKLPWKGTYVLEVKHAASAGTRGADKYDRASYVTSLTVMQGKGVTPLPAPPAARPNDMK
ncbi:MAG: DUF4198 domain-containing protein [Polaromonas sp.]|nr:DUF4198 domain-containing protein [Polaromonas sp.]